MTHIQHLPEDVQKIIIQIVGCISQFALINKYFHKFCQKNKFEQNIKLIIREAFMSKNDEYILFIIKMFTNYLQMYDCTECYVEYDNVDIYELMIALDIKFNKLCRNAALRGNMNLIEWINKKWEPYEPFDWEIYAGLAEGGHLNILKSIEQRNAFYHCVMGGAARSSNLDILEWFYVNGKYGSARGITSKDVNIIKWLIDNMGENISISNTIKEGSLDSLKFLIECTPNIIDPVDIFTAIEYGHLHILEWLKEKGHNVFYADFVYPYGDKKVFNWLIDNGYKYDHILISNAVKEGSLELLKWAIEKGCQYGNSTLTNIIECGRLDILKCAFDMKFNIDIKWVCICAVNSGQLHILKYMKSCGLYIHDYAKYMKIAKESGHLHLLNFIKGNNSKFTFLSNMHSRFNGFIKTIL